MGRWLRRLPILSKLWTVADQQQAALDAVASLRQEVAVLRAELVALRESATRDHGQTQTELRHLRAVYAEYYGALQREVEAIADVLGDDKHDAGWRPRDAA